MRVTLWACLLLTLPAVLEFWLRVRWQELFRQPWVLAYVLAPIAFGVLPYLLAIRGIRSQRYKETALGWAMVVGAVGSLYWLAAFYGGQTGMHAGFPLRLDEPESILSGLLLVTHLVLFFSAGKAAKTGAVGLQRVSCLVTALVALGILLVIGAVLVDRFQERPAFSRREARALRELRTLNTALITYAATYPQRGFPVTLAVLGLPPAGTQPSENAADLLDNQLAAGERLTGEYWLRYIPGPPDEKGRVTTYRVISRPLDYPRPGLYSFYTDESAVIRATLEDRVAAKYDTPIDELSRRR